MTPLVSIVSITYNKFDEIYRSIDSVLAQDYERIEYIIADDGSAAFPEEQIRAYTEKHKRDNIESFRILRTEKNRGTVRNLNHAYREARGEILMPLAQDDRFADSTVVRRIVQSMEKRHSDILITRRVLQDEKGNIIGYMPKEKNLKKIARLDTPEKQRKAIVKSEFYDMASGSVLAVRKAFIEEWGYFDEAYDLWEDGPFITQYTEKKKLVFDFDITSIIYNKSGVSSGGNRRLIADNIQYNNTDRIRGIENYDRLTKAKVEYIRSKDGITGKKDLYLLYLKHPIVMLSKLIFRITSY